MSWFTGWFSSQPTEQKTNLGPDSTETQPPWHGHHFGPQDPSRDQHCRSNGHHTQHHFAHHYGRRGCPKYRGHPEEEHPHEGPHGVYLGPFGPHRPRYPPGHDGYSEEQYGYPQGHCRGHRHHRWSRFGGHEHHKFQGHHGWRHGHTDHGNFENPDPRGPFPWQ